ncbi:glutathione S-conjugate-exporting ATPase Abc4 [Stylosanthes scabra]|uniref:Glutathione S-conjugate-exporting ATPase Abc4 n=1 Tax=Stylosanthes scabra TaxID=79078 RepID=A0ABU6Q447_9FABA|nr:glutathione S-conjugate-exporting ATPase Abc4 [Stylosanthes scabra]
MAATSTCCNLIHGFAHNKLNGHHLHIHINHSKRCNLDYTRSRYNNGETVLHHNRIFTRQLFLLKRRNPHQQQVSPSGFGEQVEEEESVSRETLIWRAIKLPIYSVALVPLTVGSAAAYFQTGMFSARTYFVLLASSVLVITWLNLSNDVYDFDTGADKNKKESVVNLLGSRNGTFVAAYLCIALGFVGLTWAALQARNMPSIMLLSCAIICGYVYQCPPFRLSYRGLGEPLCFAAFGPFATTAFYLLQGSARAMSQLPLTRTVISVSILVGLTTSMILFCSHFHQIESDKEVGKMSPLVRLGTARGAEVVKVAVMALYALLITFGLCKALPLSSIFLCSLTLPIGNLVVRFVQENYKDKNKIFMAKYFCVRLHALFGAALACGLVVARVV